MRLLNNGLKKLSLLSRGIVYGKGLKRDFVEIN